MASLRDIRNRISSVKNIQQVTRAMKMVAAAKLRRAQERIFKTRPYAYRISVITSHLKRYLDPTAHPLFRPHAEPGGRVLLVVVTADRGLAGGFNSNIIKLTEQTIAQDYADARDRGNLFLVCVGRKGHEHFSKRGYQLIGDYRGVFDNLNFDMAREVVEIAVEGFREERWNEVKVIYNEFRNTIAQNRIVEPFLPIPAELFMTPVMALENVEYEQYDGPYAVDYIFEPEASGILEQLVPLYLNYQMWRIFLESNASEQGARMVAMDNATNNADELLRDLRLKYNRARQDAITKEIIEITSGANALESA